MLPIETLNKPKGLRFILCDIDDTLTNDGKLCPEAYAALWKLHDAGLQVIPVTGRPAGWCDLIIRQWPVRAVVGENGAFVYYYENDAIKTFTHPSVAGEERRQRLEDIKDACLREVPGCRVAKDQFSRVYDLAIDFNEDPPYLGFEAAQKILAVCLGMGAQAKVSSIHVNTWFGSYDKLEMTRLFFREVLRQDNLRDQCLFFGDSPNDEPMFAYFPYSCGVENVLQFADTMRFLPAYLTKPEGGRGFAHAVGHILRG